MLLEFRVKNFRSIRDEQRLSLVASTDKTFAETHLLSTGMKTPESVVRSSVIYGPNASGKSNLLAGLAYMRAVVAESATVVQPGQQYTVQPFRLNAQTSKEPSEFEITFAEEGVRYQYGFSLLPDQVVDEWLLVYRTAKPQQWFERRFDAQTKTHHYEFSSHLTGSRKLWQDSTRPNALFLSTAVQLNSDLLRPIFSAIVDKVVYFPSGAMPIPDITTALLKDASSKKAVRDFLSSADIGISDIQTISRKGFHQRIEFSPTGGATQSVAEEHEMQMPQFVHETAGGSARFEFHEESLGTQRLYAFAAPVLDVLRGGKLLVVDELDSSLHTKLVRRLVDMFHGDTVNSNGAQLIFSTHDTSLLEDSLFRRDQIWFTEKGRDQATRLYPLTDFSPRKKEALERGYLSGRYGAIPFFAEPHAAVEPEKVAG
jgi:ABC-type cobalamin transport system ATPase subunit